MVKQICNTAAFTGLVVTCFWMVAVLTVSVLNGGGTGSAEEMQWTMYPITGVTLLTFITGWVGGWGTNR